MWKRFRGGGEKDNLSFTPVSLIQAPHLRACERIKQRKKKWKPKREAFKYSKNHPPYCTLEHKDSKLDKQQGGKKNPDGNGDGR